MLDHYTTGLVSKKGRAPLYGVQFGGSLTCFNYLFGRARRKSEHAPSDLRQLSLSRWLIRSD